MPTLISLSHLLRIAVVCLFVFPSYQAGAATNINKIKYQAMQYYYGSGVPKDLTKALQLYLQAAEQGDSEAQYIAGGMFYKGYGTPRDLSKAFSLLYGAAVEGSSTPQSEKLLGQFFLTGTTIPQNLSEAMKWYQRSAENGDRESQSELAFLYFTGRGGEKDLEKALYWYEQSARQGLAVAQYSLGIMYYSGSGLERADVIKAYGWISLSASQNHRDAIAARTYLETTFSATELQQAQDYALKLFQEING